MATRLWGSVEMRSASECLQKPKGRLAAVMAQGERIARINRLIKALLPPSLQEQARLKSLSPQCWVLQTDSSAWATRLRYVLPGLRQQLEAELKQPVPELKLRVEPRSGAPAKRPPRRLTLTQSNADLLKSTARGINDEKLGAALMRLAQRCNTRECSD